MPRRQKAPSPQPDSKRLTIVTFGIFWCLAGLVLVVCEFIVPAVASASSPSPSGLNYGAIFGANFFRPFGLIVAVALVILAPITLLFRAAEDLGDRLRKWVRGGRSNS